jgi:hypothetical protein
MSHEKVYDRELREEALRKEHQSILGRHWYKDDNHFARALDAMSEACLTFGLDMQLEIDRLRAALINEKIVASQRRT